MVHALWTLVVPTQAVDAGLVFFDLYNGCDRDITVSSVKAVRDGAVAVTGLLTVQMTLTRTTAPDTGGTEATSNGTSGCTISNIQQSALPSGISARLTPTNVSNGAVISQRNLHPEESLVQAPLEFLDTLLTVPEGTGIRVIQGPVASVGYVCFQVLFY